MRRTNGRRWFVRSAAGATLAVLAKGTQALLGAAPASAQAPIPCCWLIGTTSPWCPMYCSEAGHSLRCWTCNNGQCKCCECTTGADCWSDFSVCSYKVGCCLTS